MDTSHFSPNLKEECHGDGTCNSFFSNHYGSSFLLTFIFCVWIFIPLSLSLFAYMFIYVFHNELNTIVLRSICALLCLSQGVKHHCVKVHEKKQVQGQVEPKRFKLSRNRFFYPLSMFTTTRQRMSLLKIHFRFFQHFFSFYDSCKK